MAQFLALSTRTTSLPLACSVTYTFIGQPRLLTPSTIRRTVSRAIVNHLFWKHHTFNHPLTPTMPEISPHYCTFTTQQLSPTPSLHTRTPKPLSVHPTPNPLPLHSTFTFGFTVHNRCLGTHHYCKLHTSVLFAIVVEKPSVRSATVGTHPSISSL